MDLCRLLPLHSHSSQREAADGMCTTSRQEGSNLREKDTVTTFSSLHLSPPPEYCCPAGHEWVLFLRRQQEKVHSSWQVWQHRSHCSFLFTLLPGYTFWIGKHERWGRLLHMVVTGLSGLFSELIEQGVYACLCREAATGCPSTRMTIAWKYSTNLPDSLPKTELHWTTNACASHATWFKWVANC